MPLTILLIFLVFAVLTILLLATIVILRTLLVKPAAPPVKTAELADVNGLDIAANLAEVIQCKTVSLDQSGIQNAKAFEELHEILRKNYPLVHTNLSLQKINQYSLLYTWQGIQPELQPALFAAHQDVVPVDEGSLDQWEYPPFSGAIADGYVWGRGALDIKCQITTLLDSVEYLLKQGYQPKRTLYLAFGHDEEIGGANGAAVIAAMLQKQGIKLSAVIDEGGGVVTGAFPGIKFPLALIGTAEKSSVTLELSVESPPGHSSAPPAHTSIGTLALALTRLEARPMPATLKHIRPMLQSMTPHLDFLMKMAFSNLWLFEDLVLNSLAKNPQSNALLRTTTAITIIAGGIKENVLPARASALVNYRLAPGDSLEKVIEHTRTAISNPGVKITVQESDEERRSSPVSSTNTPAYALLSNAIDQVFDNTPAAPFLVTGATDSRHYTEICQNVYRFSPFLVSKEEMGRIHGIGERISVKNLEQMARFFTYLIQLWGDADTL